MNCFYGCIVLPSLLCFMACLPRAGGESTDFTTLPARSLDVLLQSYAYQAFVHPRSRTQFDAEVPMNFSGMKLAAMRLRRSSLRKRGVENYKEFTIPAGIIESPYAKRVVLVYQNLGNWSSAFYQTPGYRLVAPVLGLLAYDGDNFSATHLRELRLNASCDPIVIRFSSVERIPVLSTPKCMWYDLNGVIELSDLVSSDECAASGLGHFSIVVNSTEKADNPKPWRRGRAAERGNESRPWKIAMDVIWGLLGVVVLGLIVVWAVRRRQMRKMSRMQQQAETGESLRMASIGKSIVPVAGVTRTLPELETEYAP